MLLGASRRLPDAAIVGMEMRGAVGDGVLHSHVPLQPLMQIARLRDVDRTPAPILSLPSIDVKAGQWPESRIQRIHLVLILLAGLTGPLDERRSRTLRLPVTTK